MYYNEELVTNSKFQTQLSEKLQRFRTCRKNKNAPFFMIFPNISFFHMVVNYWTDPLKKNGGVTLVDGLLRMWHLQIKDQSSQLQPHEKMTYSERS